MVINLIKQISVAPQNWFFVPLILVIYVLMIAFVILMTNAERRIPVQYAKRVVGRKMYGGQTNHIPIKVAMAGVMPIIFAMSIMSLPATIGYFFGVTATSGHAFWSDFIALFSTNNVVYAILYFFLIIGFNYFYIAMQYNPVQIANDLKKNNGAIPGYRPGKPHIGFHPQLTFKGYSGRCNIPWYHRNIPYYIPEPHRHHRSFTRWYDNTHRSRCCP